MAAILVADTISEIIERMSSLSICGQNIPKKVKEHLSTLTEKKCPNVDLQDATRKEWFGELRNVVTDLFYLVDDLRQQQSDKSFFSACNFTPRRQLKAIEKSLRKIASESSLNKVKTSPNQESEMMERYKRLNLDSLHKKQCFAYCAFVFSARDSIKTDMLIRLWMGEGFLRPVPSTSQQEDLGHAIIAEFIQKEIFFKIGENMVWMDYSKKDVAKYAAGENYLYVNRERYPHKEDEVSKEVQRVAMAENVDVSNGIPDSLLKKAEHLQTFLLPLGWNEWELLIAREVKLSWAARDEICSTFKKLRVLTLRDLGMGSMPASIGGLQDLRYLDLSHNYMTKLPHSVGELKHLETLLLSQCYKLEALPDGSGYFKSLRHLYVDQCLKLKRMPHALRKLTGLRTLPHFVASAHNGLSELVHLNNLRRDLTISHLMRVKLKTSEACFYLRDKQHLEGLTLRWNFEKNRCNEKPSPKEKRNHYQLLSQLEPHPNLKRLSLIGYKGNQFPIWLSKINNLVEISLYFCSECLSLPSLAQMTSLEKLTLVRLKSLQFITDQDNDLERMKIKKVKISDCPNLTSWWGQGISPNNVVFNSALSKLVLEYCPKLESMPLFPKLKDKLVLDCSNMKPLENTLENTLRTRDTPLSKLANLTIRGCTDLNKIKGRKNLARLEKLCISNCTNIKLPAEEWKGMKCLDSLIMEDIPDLDSLPPGIEEIEHVNLLQIKSCPELKTLQIGENIQFLEIEDCPKLAQVSHSQEPPLLRLTINKCPMYKANLNPTTTDN